MQILNKNSPKKINNITRCKALLGTFVEVTINANEAEDYLLEMTSEIFKEIERIEKMMSFYDQDSEISYLNQNAHKKDCKISPELIEVLKTAINISNLSNGLYDITIAPQLIKQNLLPNKYKFFNKSATFKDIIIKDDYIFFNKRMIIDLGGIAKGYAIDKAMNLFEDCQDMDIVINAGGDLVMNNPYGKLIDIKYSNSPKTIKLPMLNKALATSGNYYQDKNKSTIINPKNKKPFFSNNVISIFAENCMLADALTKAVFLMPDSRYLLKSLSAKAFKIDETGKLIN